MAVKRHSRFGAVALSIVVLLAAIVGVSLFFPGGDWIGSGKVIGDPGKLSCPLMEGVDCPAIGTGKGPTYPVAKIIALNYCKNEYKDCKIPQALESVEQLSLCTSAGCSFGETLEDDRCKLKKAINFHGDGKHCTYIFFDELGFPVGEPRCTLDEPGSDEPAGWSVEYNGRYNTGLPNTESVKPTGEPVGNYTCVPKE